MTVVGIVAGTLTTACWIPQLARSWRTRSAGDFSWWYLVVLTAGIALWLIYGILRRDPVIISANVFALMSLLVLSGLKSLTRRPGRVERVG